MPSRRKYTIARYLGLVFTTSSGFRLPSGILPAAHQLQFLFRGQRIKKARSRFKIGFEVIPFKLSSGSLSVVALVEKYFHLAIDFDAELSYLDVTAR